MPCGCAATKGAPTVCLCVGKSTCADDTLASSSIHIHTRRPAEHPGHTLRETRTRPRLYSITVRVSYCGRGIDASTTSSSTSIYARKQGRWDVVIIDASGSMCELRLLSVLRDRRHPPERDKSCFS